MSVGGWVAISDAAKAAILEHWHAGLSGNESARLLHMTRGAVYGFRYRQRCAGLVPDLPIGVSISPDDDSDDMDGPEWPTPGQVTIRRFSWEDPSWRDPLIAYNVAA